MMKVGGFYVPETCPHFPQRLAATDGRMDHETIREALKYVKGQDRAIDVGAHIGTWTRQLAGQFKEIVAFEPNQEIFRYLLANLREIGNVVALPVALGQHVDRIVMDTRTMNSGQAFVMPLSAVAGLWSPMMRLDDLNFEQVDLLKIDAEGFEYSVLTGGLETVLACRPVIVLEENDCSKRYGQEPRSAGDLLKAYGAKEVYRTEYIQNNFDVVFAWTEE